MFGCVHFAVAPWGEAVFTATVTAWAILTYFQAAEVIDTSDIWEVGNAVEVL